MKSIVTVSIEAIIIGLLLVGFAKIVELFITRSSPTLNMDTLTIIFISGVLIHIVFEYTGINHWYAINYPVS